MRHRSPSGPGRRSGISAEGTVYRFWRRGGDEPVDDASTTMRCSQHARCRTDFTVRPASVRRRAGHRGRHPSVSSQRPQRTVFAAAHQFRMVRDHRRRSAQPRAVRGASGFTLVEILVALAVLAVALTAGMRAVAQSADAATLLKQRTLALWVAQNRLAWAQLEAPWPAVGERNGSAVQAGDELRVARNRVRHAEPGVSPDRDRRRRRRATRLRSRPADGVPGPGSVAMTGKRAGFTLVELLIALAILALVATSATAQSHRSPTVKRGLPRKGSIGEISMLFSRASRPMLAPRCRARRAPARGWSPRGSAASASRAMPKLRFSRAGPEFSVESGSAGQRIGYRLRDGAVEVMYWPYLDQPATASPQPYALIGGVTRFRVAYLDALGALARPLACARRARDSPCDSRGADARRRRSHRAMARVAMSRDARRGDHPGDADRSAGRGRRGHGVRRAAALGPHRVASPRSGTGAGARAGRRAMGAADSGGGRPPAGDRPSRRAVGADAAAHSDGRRRNPRRHRRRAGQAQRQHARTRRACRRRSARGLRRSSRREARRPRRWTSSPTGSTRTASPAIQAPKTRSISRSARRASLRMARCFGSRSWAPRRT